MLKALIKSNLAALFSYLFRGSNRKKDRGLVFKILIGVFALYIIGCFFFMFGGLFYSLCLPLAKAGLSWLYFGFAAIIAAALCFIGSVFTAKTLLFDAKDNDLLLSMPIPPAYILAARMLTLLALNYLFEILVLAPAGFIYYMNFPAELPGVVFLFLGFLFLPLIMLAFTCIFGWLLAIISARVRNKSLITTVVSLFILAAYFYFYSQMNRYLQTILQNIGPLSEKIKNTIFPVYHFGVAIAERNPVSMLLFILFTLAPFAAVYAVLSRSFIRVAATNRGIAKVKYVDKPLKVNSIKIALLKKELRHFFSNAMYIMNASLGVIFTVAAAVALVINRDLPAKVLENMPGMDLYINPLAILAICFLTATNIISAPSVSLEGKNLWISQSLPVDGGDVLLAKANMHLVICLPSVLIASFVSIITLKMTLVQSLLALIIPVLVTVFCALFGVVINLHFPKFDWINETIAIKQGMSTMIAMFASWGVITAPALLYGLLLYEKMTAEVFMLICAVIIGALCFWMQRYLKTGGKAIYARLG